MAEFELCGQPVQDTFPPRNCHWAGRTTGAWVCPNCGAKHDGWAYDETKARLEPAVFQPASLLIRAELADTLTNILGYPGTACDLVSDWRDIARHPDSYSRQEAIDTGDLLARLVDEIQGLVR